MLRITLSILLFAGLVTKANATIAVYSLGTSGAASASSDLSVSVYTYGAAPPASETGNLSLVDHISVSGDLLFTTPPSGPGTLTAGYTVSRTLYELAGISGSFDLTSFLDATVTSNLPSSSAIVTSSTLTTSLYEAMSTPGGFVDVLIGSVTAGANGLSVPVDADYTSGAAMSGPFTVAAGNSYYLEQDFTETISGIAAAETLTVDLPATSGIGTPAVPEPASLLLTIYGLIAVFFFFKKNRKPRNEGGGIHFRSAGGFGA